MQWHAQGDGHFRHLCILSHFLPAKADQINRNLLKNMDKNTEILELAIPQSEPSVSLPAGKKIGFAQMDRQVSTGYRATIQSNKWPEWDPSQAHTHGCFRHRAMTTPRTQSAGAGRSAVHKKGKLQIVACAYRETLFC